MRTTDPSPPELSVFDLVLLTRPLWPTLILCQGFGIAVITAPFW